MVREATQIATFRTPPAPVPTTDLAHWYDATEVNGSDGDAIGTWTDQEGTDDLTQATSSEKPTLKTNVMNSKNVLRFDGTDDEISASFSEISQPTTIFAVFSLSSDELADIFGSVVGRHELTNNAVDDIWQIYAGGSTITLAHSKVGPLEDVIASITFDGANSVIRLNGNENTGDVGNDGLDGLTVGGRHDDEKRQVDGDIAEVLVYNANISDSDRDDVESYLSDKWGIAI